jgi:hypothetical protein
VVVTQAPLLDKFVDPARFPIVPRVGTAAGEQYQGVSDPENLHKFGLERIFDGVGDLSKAKKEPPDRG